MSRCLSCSLLEDPESVVWIQWRKSHNNIWGYKQLLQKNIGVIHVWFLFDLHLHYSSINVVLNAGLESAK